MPAAYVPGSETVDQSGGPSPLHAGSGSRFNTLDSRVNQPIGANVSEAIAEYKAGKFTLENLRELAFAMGCQIVEGKDVPALVAKISDLETKNGALENRAIQAEAAFVAIKKELDAQNTPKKAAAKGKTE